jgi:hypothetical protein
MCPDGILNYLHALSDLRAARWMLQHRPADATVGTNEEVAIGAIKHAAIDEQEHRGPPKRRPPAG